MKKIDPRKHTTRTNRFLTLDKKNIDSVCIAVIQHLREGRTLEMFLTDYSVRKTKWDKYIRKNKAVGEAIADGLVYYKSFWQGMAVKWARRKDMNATVSKMLLENILGWEKSRDDSLGDALVAGGPSGGYRVIVECESASMKPPKEITG